MAKKPKKPDLQRAKDRNYKGPKRDQLMAPDPERVRVTKVTVVPPKHSATRARQRHAQLATQCMRADPRLA